MLLIAIKPGDQIILADTDTGKILGAFGYEPVAGTSHKIRVHLQLSESIRVIRDSVLRKAINDADHTVDVYEEVIAPGLRGELHIIFTTDGKVAGIK